MFRRLAGGRLSVLTCAWLVCAWPAFASAAGLTLSEPDAAALGRAGAATALPDGPSAIYYNPAGLTLGRGLSLQAGIAVEHERLGVTTSGVTSRSRSTLLQPTLFVAQRVGDHLALGVAVYRAPTQSLEYGGSFSGRFRGQKDSFGGPTLAPKVAGRAFPVALDRVWPSRPRSGSSTCGQAWANPAFETRAPSPGKPLAPGRDLPLGPTIGLLLVGGLPTPPTPYRWFRKISRITPFAKGGHSSPPRFIASEATAGSAPIRPGRPGFSYRKTQPPKFFRWKKLPP